MACTEVEPPVYVTITPDGDIHEEGGLEQRRRQHPAAGSVLSRRPTCWSESISLHNFGDAFRAEMLREYLVVGSICCCAGASVRSG